MWGLPGVIQKEARHSQADGVYGRLRGERTDIPSQVSTLRRLLREHRCKIPGLTASQQDDLLAKDGVDRFLMTRLSVRAVGCNGATTRRAEKLIQKHGLMNGYPHHYSTLSLPNSVPPAQRDLSSRFLSEANALNLRPDLLPLL